MLRNRLHRLHTGVLPGKLINKKHDADRRIRRVEETLEQVRDYQNQGNSKEGIQKIINTVRKLTPAGDEF